MKDIITLQFKVFISVVSHNHSDLISKLDVLRKLAESEHVEVVVKNNISDDAIKNYIMGTNIHLIDERYNNGFGYNNNFIYNFCKLSLAMSDNDYFIVLNPDVIITEDSILKLIENMESNGVLISTINLFKDTDFFIPDMSVRKFPKLYDFFSSFFLKRNDTLIDKTKITEPVSIDWCAGSFLAFKSSAYKHLKGFNTHYFMYCEDVDICYRARMAGLKVIYNPTICACHLAQHNNRKIFSKHFYWHLKSALYFLISKKYGFETKSNLIV